MVVEGELVIDLRDGDRTVTLEPNQGFVVPRGAVHRTPLLAARPCSWSRPPGWRTGD